MKLKKRLSCATQLYFVLDEQSCAKKSKAEILKAAVEGGVDIVQYRNKIDPKKRILFKARVLRRIAKRLHCPFLINDHIDIALDIDADGLHLGQNDLNVFLARKILGKDKIIGLSCHTPLQVATAQTEDLDYLGYGPLFKTRTKKAAKAIGLEHLASLIKDSKIPIFGIGGIGSSNVKKVVEKGCIRIAVSGVICNASNIKNQIKSLKNKLRS